MGMARNASSGDNGRSRWKARKLAASEVGITVPGTGWGNKHNARRRGHRNPTGAITHAPKEWGVENRKWEERTTGLAKQAELDAIAEQVAEISETEAAWRDALAAEEEAWFG